MIARGEWTDQETFVMGYDKGLGLDTYLLTMKFEANHVLIEVKELSHDNQIFHLQGQTAE